MWQIVSMISDKVRIRMHIRNLEKKDAPLMLEWMHDPDVVTYLANDFEHMKIENCLSFMEAGAKDEQNIHLAICDDKDEYLGTVSLKNINKIHQNAEYAISTRKKAHGTGAAQFGTKEILKKAFEELGLNRVYLNVLEENVRADKFYNKMGFVYEGTFCRHLFIKGEFHNLKWYGMTKEKYEQLKEKEAQA